MPGPGLLRMQAKPACSPSGNAARGAPSKSTPSDIQAAARVPTDHWRSGFALGGPSVRAALRVAMRQLSGCRRWLAVLIRADTPSTSYQWQRG